MYTTRKNTVELAPNQYPLVGGCSNSTPCIQIHMILIHIRIRASFKALAYTQELASCGLKLLKKTRFRSFKLKSTLLLN